jgi:hypothetical protein
MGREVKRVPLDFDFPWNDTRAVWTGYLMPDKFREDDCPDCERGYSKYAEKLYRRWYGHQPTKPAYTGSTALTEDTPAVRQFAERNVASAPEFYGTGELAIRLEARRLKSLWNGMWCHHLAQEDVDALVEAGRLMDFTHTWDPENRWQKIEPPVTPTATEVNGWSLSGMGHDSINASIVIEARCKRDGQPVVCGTCGGHGSREVYEGQRAEAEAWEATEPPEGPGYQLWETVSEGSPITPVFATPEELANFMVANSWGSQTERMASSFEVAMRFIDAGWAPSGVATAEHGVESGVEFVGRGVEWTAR